MQTVFEIFNPLDGKTEGYKTLDAAKAFCDKMERAGYIRDYLPCETEGFYVVDMRGSVDHGSVRITEEAAQRIADHENMANDHNSFSVVQHSL